MPVLPIIVFTGQGYQHIAVCEVCTKCRLCVCAECCLDQRLGGEYICVCIDGIVDELLTLRRV